MAGISTGIDTGDIKWGWLTILLSVVALVLAGVTIGFELAEAVVGVYIFKYAHPSPDLHYRGLDNVLAGLWAVAAKR